MYFSYSTLIHLDSSPTCNPLSCSGRHSYHAIVVRFFVNLMILCYFFYIHLIYIIIYLCNITIQVCYILFLYFFLMNMAKYKVRNIVKMCCKALHNPVKWTDIKHRKIPYRIGSGLNPYCTWSWHCVRLEIFGDWVFWTSQETKCNECWFQK